MEVEGTKAMTRRPTAQSIIELIAGLFVLIPIAFFILDVAVLLIGQEANNDLAKRTARTASNYDTDAAARNAAQTVVNKFGNNTMIKNAQLRDFQFNVGGNVVAETSVQINIPVPVPFVPAFNTQTMHARATEPIVALPAT